MFRSRITITFDLISVKGETRAKNPNAHASITNFYKIVNTHPHAIFFFNILLLFTMKKKKRDGNKSYHNNNNDENKRKRNDDDKNKRSDENDKSDKN